MGQQLVGAVVVVVIGELLEQLLQFGDCARLRFAARSQFFIVCWNRSTLPWVIGWPERELFWVKFSRRSSASNALRPPVLLIPERPVVKTMPLSVSIKAAIAWVATALRNVASTIGVVTARRAVILSAQRAQSSSQVRISVSVRSDNRQVKSHCQLLLSIAAGKRMQKERGFFFGSGQTTPTRVRPHLLGSDGD